MTNIIGVTVAAKPLRPRVALATRGAELEGAPTGDTCIEYRVVPPYTILLPQIQTKRCKSDVGRQEAANRSLHTFVSAEHTGVQSNVRTGKGRKRERTSGSHAGALGHGWDEQVTRGSRGRPGESGGEGREDMGALPHASFNLDTSTLA